MNLGFPSVTNSLLLVLNNLACDLTSRRGRRPWSCTCLRTRRVVGPPGTGVSPKTSDNVVARTFFCPLLRTWSTFEIPDETDLPLPKKTRPLCVFTCPGTLTLFLGKLTERIRITSFTFVFFLSEASLQECFHSNYGSLGPSSSPFVTSVGGHRSLIRKREKKPG